MNYTSRIALAICAITVFCTSTFAQGIANLLPPTSKVPDAGLHAVLIGTGMPIPNPARAGAATLIVADGKTFLVDVGFNAVESLVQSGYQQVDHVLFTHFHIDHYGDLDRLFFNRGTAGASEPLGVMGPKGTDEIVQKVVASVAIDEKYRIDHHKEHWPTESMQASVTESEPGVIFEEDGLKITMFEVDHEPIEIAVGYRFDFKGKSIVVSGDTKKSENLTKHARDCDVLIHEVMDEKFLTSILPMLKTRNARQGAMVEDLMEVHTSTLDVAVIAKEANVKKVVLTHLVPSIQPVEAQEKNFIRGMDEIYDGPIIVGRDSMIITAE